RAASEGRIHMENSLIQADELLTLWGIIVIVAAMSIVLEQKYSWAGKISGAVIALVSAIILSNTGIIPTGSPAYDAVCAFIVPVAILLLLSHVNSKKIWKASGRMLLIFLISSIGTVAGTILSFFLLKDTIPFLDRIGGMMGAPYVGGG